MAVSVAADADPKALSVNWKKLKKQLKSNDAKHPTQKPRWEPHDRSSRRQQRVAPSQNSLPRMSSNRSKKMSLDHAVNEESKPSVSLALWAEDNGIPAKDLAAAYGTSYNNPLVPNSFSQMDDINAGLSTNVEIGKYIAIDCEMVGVGPNPDAESALARISLVNFHGHQLYDSFVQPKEAVTDYRTAVSGITFETLQRSRTFEEVQKDVAGLLKGKILVGHAIRNDLEVLLLGHPLRDIRDTSKHPAFRLVVGGKTPSLKRLAKEVLGVHIQSGAHSSLEDARATMLLFRREKDSFEREHLEKWGPDRKHPANGGGTQKNKSKRKQKWRT